MIDAMSYISSFSKSGTKIENLDRIASLMASVGNPHKKLKFIHVAGTNGKGSMCEMFNEILVQAGYKVGLFTSPYIVEYSDRIRVNSKNIPYEDIERIIKQIRPNIDANPMCINFSQFEITQALAFCYFVEQDCDVVVLETGLGGLLDSTNIIENPIVSVIGSVSYDHIAVLGDTIEEIAEQKAGIIKAGCPVVLNPKNEIAVTQVISKKAKNMKSKLIIPITDFCVIDSIDIFGSRFSFNGDNYKISMAGEHQIANAITVIEAIGVISKSLPILHNDVVSGLEKAKLFGRVEVIAENPLTILDGSHNPDGTKALAGFVENLPKPINVVIGMHIDKNALDAVKNLIPVVDSFVAVDNFSPVSYEKSDLAWIIRGAGGLCEIADDSIVETIIKQRKNNPQGTVLICGSLYMVSYVKAHMTEEHFAGEKT